MAVRDQNESDTNLPSSISLGARASPPMEEQVTLADEYAPKIRKPYTITKQREKWSEEEHRKFLEALKLHGRAWRRIEEHVGTKTAVQIRSHAQKFFTKVVRDSNNGDASAVKFVNIPPPRPKRKPMHPYPRKLAIPVKSVTLAPEELKRSASPENQSPTSVLSSPGSDAFDMVDSSKPSEGSSAVAENSGDLVLSELDERRGSVEASSTQCLKLFGKTLMLAESGETSLTDVKDEPLSSTLTICPPWGLPHVSAAFPCTRVHNPIPIKGRPIFHENDFDDNDTQKEGSSTGSNTECASTESNGDKNSEIEAQSRSRASAPSSFLRRVSSTKRVRGFVPYKRCLVERDISSSALTGEEGEERRTWLCL